MGRGLSSAGRGEDTENERSAIKTVALRMGTGETGRTGPAASGEGPATGGSGGECGEDAAMGGGREGGEFNGNDVYYNMHSKEYSYFYADHSCDDYQYWVKDNLKKLGLQE